MKTTLIACLFAVAGFLTNAAAAQESQTFHTPSKNVYCYADVTDAVTTVDCELLSKNSNKPLRPVPSDCEQDWGNRFALNDSGKAFMVCAGDTLRSNSAANFPYGRQFDYYGITCTSSEQGLECINNDGHGFKISKSKQEMY